MDRDQTLIRQYLLGELTEQAQEPFEQRLMTDKHFFNEFLRLEEALIDEYVSGALSGSDRERFEKSFLTSPERRESVGFAQAFNRFLSEDAGRRLQSRPDGQAPAFTRQVPAVLAAKRPSRSVTIALAVATVVSAAAAVFLLVQAAGLKRQVFDLRSSLSRQEADLTNRLAELKKQEEELARQLEETAVKRADLEREIETLRGTSARNRSNSTSNVVSLLLSAGLQRAGGQANRVFVRNDDALRLQLKLDDFRQGRYNLVIQTVEGKQVWSRSNLTAARIQPGTAVIATLSAGVLPEGDYVAVLSLALPGGGYESIGTYHFTLLKRQ